MSEALKIAQDKKARILLLSLRNLKFHVSRCSSYELEDTVCDFDAVDVIAPVLSPSLFKVTNKVANYAVQAVGNSRLLNPVFNQISLTQEYDLFFVICQSPLDLLCINSIKNWRSKCRKAVIWLDEIWKKDINKLRPQLSVLKSFDHIFMNFYDSISGVSNVIQRPCHYIPFGVDTLKFCPYPVSSKRSIDFYSIGRRSQITHQALLDLSNTKDFFYIYETIKDLYMVDYNYHRSLYRNLVKRSRYFIANKAKFDNMNETGGQEEIGCRFFEGAAGGAVMLGVPPTGESFRKQFDWQDAVIQIPYDAANIADIIGDLDSQPERLERIRINNVANSLLRHDWVYRWKRILDIVGLEATPEMKLRESHLQHLADEIMLDPSKQQQKTRTSSKPHPNLKSEALSSEAILPH